MSKSKKQKSLRVIPLGGLGEVGRNMTVVEWNEKILIIDMGLMFPEEDMPGVDYVVPDITYLSRRKKNILGAVFTHGHYDHIGAIPYIIDKIGNPPLFCSSMTKGIILKRQGEFPQQSQLAITDVEDGSIVSLGPFRIEFFRQNHSIPGNLGLFIQTPIGNIIHTSDFKFDETPANAPPTDFAKLKKIGSRGILFLMSDSTRAEKKGHSISEKRIIENLDKIFKESRGRIIVATFASLIDRIQEIIMLSEKYNRKVAIEGYSMKTNVEIARHLGYVKGQKETFIKTKKIADYPDSKITLLCTGAQGEDRAILMRIANKEHPRLQFKKGDTVIFSSSVVPGNERTVQVLKDELYRQKTKVFHYEMMDIHAGGHAHQQELLQMAQIMKPKFFLPIHGQYSMLINHAEIIKNSGLVPEKNIVVVENGRIIKVNSNKISVSKKRIPVHYVMVDGLGVGDVGNVVLRDRKTLAKDGMFVIVVVVDQETGKVRESPDIISRGFVYLRESKELLSQTREKVTKLVDVAAGSGGSMNWAYIKNRIRNQVGDFLFTKTKRRPMVLPVVIQV